MSGTGEDDNWPDECPICGADVEQHPRTLTWCCPKCGCDEDGLRDLAEDRGMKAAKEGI